MPEKSQLSGKNSFTGEDYEQTGRSNDPVESCLVGLLAGPVVVFPHLAGAGIARYNQCQDMSLPGKTSIYSRLARLALIRLELLP